LIFLAVNNLVNPIEMPHADWEATHPLLLVGKHFATKGLLIVGVWGVRHLLWKHGIKREGEKRLAVKFCL